MRSNSRSANSNSTSNDLTFHNNSISNGNATSNIN